MKANATTEQKQRLLEESADVSEDKIRAMVAEIAASCADPESITLAGHLNVIPVYVNPHIPKNIAAIYDGEEICMWIVGLS